MTERNERWINLYVEKVIVSQDFELLNEGSPKEETENLKLYVPPKKI